MSSITKTLINSNGKYTLINAYWFNYVLSKNFTKKKKKRLLFFYTYHVFSTSIKLNKLKFLLSSEYSVYFIKKEVFYTKLKYSRVPQFDTSSGAAASFISGFYGFLVCEKFGFEVIDSGDFLFFTVYIILFAFALVLLLKIFNYKTFLLKSFILLIRSFFYHN